MILFRLELKHQQFDQTKTFNSEKAMLKKDVVYGRKCGGLFVTSGKTMNTNTAQTLFGCMKRSPCKCFCNSFESLR